MKAAQIYDLDGSYGTIQHQHIWDAVSSWGIDTLLVTLMVDRPDTSGIYRKTLDTKAADPRTRDYVMSRGINFGFVRVPEWTGADEVTLARLLNDDLNRYGLDGKVHNRADPCLVVVNGESHAFNILAFEDAWRGSVATRPSRDTIWGLEGFQSGRFNNQVVTRINQDTHLTVVPEAYDGAMHPYAHDRVKDDLTGVGLTRVGVYYDFIRGAPAGMNGIGYVLERLPGTAARSALIVESPMKRYKKP